MAVSIGLSRAQKVMSKTAGAGFGVTGWLQKSRWQALRLRWTGWKCEGPFPPFREGRVLILGPGLSRGSKEAALLESRLRFNTRWLDGGQPLNMSASPSEANTTSRVKWLVPCTDDHLISVLQHCHANGQAVQLVNVAPRFKRIRCNTPFQPGRFTEREGQYIHRLFSYDG